jgi:hypothetical protein
MPAHLMRAVSFIFGKNRSGSFWELSFTSLKGLHIPLFLTGFEPFQNKFFPHDTLSHSLNLTHKILCNSPSSAGLLKKSGSSLAHSPVYHGFGAVPIP